MRDEDESIPMLGLLSVARCTTRGAGELLGDQRLQSRPAHVEKRKKGHEDTTSPGHMVGASRAIT